MIGISDAEYAVIRFENFAAEVLAPAVHRHRCALQLSVHQCAGPLASEELAAASFAPASVGFRWGPCWSTAYFRIQGSVPEEMAGEAVALRFSSGTEALLRRGGAAVRGLDENHPEVVLFDPASGGEAVDLMVEAACNLPLGVSTFFWDDPEVRRRWQEAAPGRVESCELVSVDRCLWSFVQKYELARQLAVALPEGDPRVAELIHGLRELTLRLDPGDLPAGREEAETRLDALLRGRGSRGVSRCWAVGHAHIDTAWLWPLRETRRKVMRSWSNALELFERFESFHFVASQPAQYAMLEEDAPELFEALRRRVGEGRFEPQGAMWVEPDCKLPSIESLIRQIQHGVGYWRERFGDDAPQSVLFLPDSFGFPAGLPQIARLAGLDTFVTNKLSWCERNEFPFVTFRWRGLDGTELLSHFTPGHDYNSALMPADLLRGEDHLVRKDRVEIGRRTAAIDAWLQPFGFGDGGGGPNEVTAMRAALGADVEGLPQVVQGRMDAFCRHLHEERARLREAEQRDLPVWDGELYLELHRGTATSQSRVKRSNLAAERALRRIEILLAMGGPLAEATRERLDRAWKTVLLHQFHDILPGVSIAAVYEDAGVAYQALQEELDALWSEAEAAATGRLDASGEAALTVFHPGSHRRDAVIEHGGRLLRLRDLAPLELRVVDPDDPALGPGDSEPVRVQGRTLENSKLRCRLDEAGRISELFDKVRDRRVNAVAAEAEVVPVEDGVCPLNQLVVHDDRPRRWEAWDVDHDLADRTVILDGPAASIEVVEENPLRGAIEVVRRYGDSTIRQRYVLECDSVRLDVELEVDWREERSMLRSLWAVDVRAREATAGTQGGWLRRSAHRNTSREEAQFEFTAHRWVDLSETGFGVALWDDGKWGRSVHGNVLGLSLLRAPNFPDPGADRHTHQFTYGVVVHGGDPVVARVAALAEERVDPPVVLARGERSGGDEDGRRSWTPLRCMAAEAGRVEILALQPGADGRSSILRLGERGGGRCRVSLWWNDPQPEPEVVDLLERSASEGGVAPRPAGFTHDGGETSFELGPFQIVSLRLPTPQG